MTEICTWCWKYAIDGKCPLCCSGDRLEDKAELLPTQHVLLWMGTDGEEIVDHFVQQGGDFEDLPVWKEFLAYLAQQGKGDLTASDGTRLDDPNLGRWLLDDYLAERAEILWSID